MLILILSIVTSLVSDKNPHDGYEVIDYCNAENSHLTLENQIRLNIGCSEVNGKRVLSEEEIERIYLSE